MTDKVHAGRGAGSPVGTLRWPELVLGLLLLAVGGGIGTLLLGTKSSPPEERTPEPEVSTSVIPASPGTVAGGAAPAPAAKPTAVKETSRIPPAPPPPPVAKIPPPVLPEPVAPPAAPKASAPTAAAPSGNVAAPPTASAPAPVAAGAPESGVRPPAAPVAASPQPGGAVPTSEVRTPLRSDYRVTLGTFSSQAAVAEGTAAVRTLGYTVYAIDLGNQFVAQVGPFADEVTGSRALTDIQRVYPRALLYRPRGQAAPAAGEAFSEAETAEPTPAEESAAPTPEPQEENVAAAPETVTAPPEPAAPAPPAGPVYLQVGAFNNSEGAQRFVEELRARGLNPAVNAPAGGKVTVLLGPFEGEALLATERQLDAAGYDHFRLR